MPEGLFDRWSRRKQEARTGEAREEPKLGAIQSVPVEPPQTLSMPAVPEGPGPGHVPADTPAPLTLADVQALTTDSDFRPFIAKDVAPEVKNAAFKKLFADPHFNVMDGLDTYVDDYTKPKPLPESVLRQMASAKFLKLFDETPEETSGDGGLPDVAQSGDSGDLPSQPVAHARPASQESDDHLAVLRLHPDNAPRPEDARDGIG